MTYERDRKGGIMWKEVGLVVAVLALIWITTGSSEGIAQSGGAEEFYKGATIKFIVPYGAGGSYDLWARTLAPLLEKHTGAKVNVENMPGGGGLKAIDYLYGTAKPDGLSLSISGMAALVLAKMLELPEAAKSDVEKLSFVGRILIDERALFATRASGFRSIVDMQKTSVPIRFTSTGGAADSSVDSALVSEGFGLNAKIIPGSSGAAEDLILLAEGKANAKCSPFSSADYRRAVEKGDLNLILFFGRKGNPDYPQVPLALEAPGIKPGGQKYIELISDLPEAGRMILTSPGVPGERVSFLERALSASLKDPGLVNWSKKEGANISYLSGKDSRALVAKMMGLVPLAERANLKRIVFEKYY